MSEELRKKVMEAIAQHKMRPRWHFILLSALVAAGALLLTIALLYVASLALFFVHENGGWYAPAFGGRGWAVLLHSAPVLLLVLVAIFAILLEILFRKYSFAYRAPLMLTLGGILVLVFVGGFTIAQTSLHRTLENEAHRGHLPPPIMMWYKAPFRAPPPGDVVRGAVVMHEQGRMIIMNEEGTSTVLISRKTRLPYGEDFEPGDAVMIIGDVEGTGTIRAFGIREINEDEIHN